MRHGSRVSWVGGIEGRMRGESQGQSSCGTREAWGRAGEQVQFIQSVCSDMMQSISQNFDFSWPSEVELVSNSTTWGK